MSGRTLRGYAAALGDLIRLTSIDELQAVEALDGAGITRQSLQAAEVDDHDLDAIYPKQEG